jgi:hypothetical protein
MMASSRAASGSGWRADAATALALGYREQPFAEDTRRFVIGQVSIAERIGAEPDSLRGRNQH